MKRDISKRIVYRFTNVFTKQETLKVEKPYLPFWAISGHYSKLYKRLKVAALDCENKLIVGKKWFESGKGNRTIISFSSGIKLDVPFDLNEDNVQIIKHYLEGIKMSLK